MSAIKNGDAGGAWTADPRGAGQPHPAGVASDRTWTATSQDLPHACDLPNDPMRESKYLCMKINILYFNILHRRDITFLI